MDLSGFSFNNGGDNADHFNMDFFSAEQVKENKKSEGKKEKKRKNNDSKESGFLINLPVEVTGRNFNVTLEGSGTISGSDVIGKLEVLGFHEVLLSGVRLTFDEGSGKLYVCSSDLKAESSDILADLSENRIIKVVDGLLVAEYDITHFPGYEGDEISIDMLKNAFIDSNPQYRGCQLAYDHVQGLAYPVLQKVEKISFPLNVYYRGELKVMEKELSEKDIISEFCGEINQVIPLLKQLHNGIIIEYSCNSKNFFTSSRKNAASASVKKKVEAKYTLPLNVFISTFGCKIELTEENFPQKSKITIDDIKAKLGEEMAIFKDSKREFDFLYLEDQNTLFIAIISGKKGACNDKAKRMGKPIIKMVESEEEYNKNLASNNFIGVYDDSKGNVIKMLCLPHGNFLGIYGSGMECGTIKKVIFQRKLPLVGKKVLDEVLDYFRSIPDKEAVVRIIYNKDRNKYFVRKSRGDRHKCHIAYFFDDKGITANSNLVCAMEVHSHNTMPAFFSSIDDADEVYPGVFGVMGDIDSTRPSVLFRAGLDGVFSNVKIHELFHMEG